MFIPTGKLLEQLQELVEEARQLVVSGEGGGGAVRLTVDGLLQVREVFLGERAALLLARGELAGAVREAFNGATGEVRRHLREKVAQKTGLSLPHLPGLF
ncbi:YbaB/EbfC family nucleoid-associated protein [Desulfovirgula thermocuniculi]|uniref:YbaB/EbfC family nucleoid-associated protein n=1 Tax=Desulfovirgula thermocuniculi TaxID=348842 RepID=UPI00041CE2D9|nr:YbaB/EbfC family nucleoid-associated protein [Desulfovirgula thermocuniculi]